jgi:hypothetical protein
LNAYWDVISRVFCRTSCITLITFEFVNSLILIIHASILDSRHAIGQKKLLSNYIMAFHGCVLVALQDCCNKAIDPSLDLDH